VGSKIQKVLCLAYARKENRLLIQHLHFHCIDCIAKYIYLQGGGGWWDGGRHNAESIMLWLDKKTAY